MENARLKLQERLLNVNKRQWRSKGVSRTLTHSERPVEGPRSLLETNALRSVIQVAGTGLKYIESNGLASCGCNSGQRVVQPAECSILPASF